MKTILIPTDFTIESLNTVKGAFKRDSQEKVNLILLYAIGMSDSITDLLFFSKEKFIASQQSGKFAEAFQILQNTYDSQINSFRVELFSGYTQNAFANFLEANQVDEVFIPKDYTLKLQHKRSFNPLPFLKKCKLPKTEISWNEGPFVHEKDHVSELFLVSNHA
ncbi:hypothetical protein [Arundinibacter roseus]|uniref:Universal stress protein n=1 Tax=Arundinibacter roseus TaxID=2070510 RepID=A0A4R4K0L8_9BACT|nr:hypothetical protein [Arundinibacter roseus]TDB60022.1 hypothetical protein EZE20_21350 [Arundinibacter roseus]